MANFITNPRLKAVLPSLESIRDSKNHVGNILNSIIRMSHNTLIRKGFYIRGSKISDRRFVSYTTPKAVQSVPRPEGKLFMFSYVPEGKDDPNLPYYDRYPLLLLMNRDSEGFEGFNLHYIPIRQRPRVMMELSQRFLFFGSVESTEFRFTYDTVKNDSNMRLLLASYRRYTNKYMQSLIFEVKPNHWGNVLYMPFALFMRSGSFVPSTVVWREQLKKIMIEQ